MLKTDILIVGGGLAGLAAARTLEGKKDYLLFEKNARVGGLSGSVTSDGYTFDHSGHLLHLRWPRTRELILGLLGRNKVLLRRDSRVFMAGGFTPFPFQVNLAGLPPKLRSECVRGFVAAFEKRLKAGGAPVKEEHFKAWSLAVFGEGISRRFMLPYNAKLWQYPLERLTTEWCAPFVPMPSLAEVLEGAYLGEKTSLGYNPEFYYPTKGGIQALPDAMARGLKGVKTGREVVAVDLKRRVALVKGIGEVGFKTLVNTSPLKYFLGTVKNLPPRLAALNSKLRHNSVRVLNLGAGGRTHPFHWAYFPEPGFSFYRAGVSTNFSARLAPRGKNSFYVETATRAGAAFNEAAAGRAIIKGLANSGFLEKPSMADKLFWMNIECAYVIYDRDRARAVPELLSWLGSRNVRSIGRYGAWKYSFMEESVKEGLETADSLLAGRR